MSGPRRIVVGNVGGRSRVIETGTPERTHVARHTPGFEQSVVWATPSAPTADVPASDPAIALATLVPGAGQTRMIVLTVPPDAVYARPDFEPGPAALEMAEIAPGLAELFEVEHPGMHTTPTVDYDVVIEGELCLELTDGEIVVGAGDIVIQHGARHAWRNRTDKPARLLAVLIGTETGSPEEK